MVLIFFLNFSCLMTLLRYPEVRAGAGADIIPVCILTLPSLWCFGWDMSPVDFWKRGGIIWIAAQNKIDSSSLAVTDQLICLQGKWRLTLDHVPFNDMIFLLIFVTCDTHTFILFHVVSCTWDFCEVFLYHLY